MLLAHEVVLTCTLALFGCSLSLLWRAAAWDTRIYKKRRLLYGSLDRPNRLGRNEATGEARRNEATLATMLWMGWEGKMRWRWG